jgi:hypothetical protein
MNFKYYLFFLLISWCPSILAQSLQGYVLEEGTNKPIANATIRLGKKITKSKENGLFSLLSVEKSGIIEIKHLGYYPSTTNIILPQSLTLTFYLKPQLTIMDEVIIRLDETTNRASPLGLDKISQKDLSIAPSFLGQKDAIRVIQTMPGVGKGGDGNSGMYVRGGVSGQNLTLLNDASIYNPTHLMGLFSVFNSESISQVNLFKLGVPADHEGRLSAMLEVNTSKEITDSLKIITDLGLFYSNTSAKIPVTKNLSVSFFGRQTFMNKTIWPLLNQMGQSEFFKNLSYDFFDYNLIINARLSNKDFLYLSKFASGDDFGITRFGFNNNMDWKNNALSFNWKHLWNNKLVLNTYVTSSDYHFNFRLTQNSYNAGITSFLKDINLKTVLSYFSKSNTFNVGAQYLDYKFTPNTPFAQSSETTLDFGSLKNYYADHFALFVKDELQLGEKTKISGGVRLNYFRHKGPYNYTNKDGSEVSIVGNSSISNKIYAESHLSISYNLNERSALKFNISNNTQPLHLISITSINFPADFWIPSIGDIRPEQAHQLSIGYTHSFRDNIFQAYTDVFYKKMNHLVEFSGGFMNLLDNLNIENNLVFGQGVAYGAEFFLKKTTGKLNGWIAYTISKSDRKFPALNQSKSYPFKYDRRHDLNIVASYPINRHWKLSGLFTFATGNAITEPVSRYTISDNIINEYGPLNGGRMPTYHRMDISATRTFKSFKKWDSDLSISVFNIYNRKNPIFSFYKAVGDATKSRIQIEPQSIVLLPILPTINYKIQFN